MTTHLPAQPGSAAPDRRVLTGTVMPSAIVDPTTGWIPLVEAWLRSFSSPATKAGYAREAKQWTHWCEASGIDPLTARRHQVEAYAEQARDAGDSDRTLTRRLSAVSSLYKYGASIGATSGNPVKDVRRPKISKTSSPSQSLERTEVPALMARAHADGPRSAALIALLVIRGLRVSEALAARIEDLGYDKGHRVLTIRSKGGEEEKVALPAPVAHAVVLAAADRTTGPILATRSGKPMDRRHAHRTVRRLCKAAGIADADRIGPHDLRHTAVTGVLDAGVGLDAAQRFARHKDPRTTKLYDHRRQVLDDDPSYRLAGWFSSAE